MKPGNLFLNFCLCLSVFACQENLSSKKLSLWYKTPAVTSGEALLLANGRLGAMPDGGVFREYVTLNDLTVRRGSVDDSVQNSGALSLAFGQLLGNLRLNYFFRDTDSLEYSDYERGLSLDDAMAWTRFKLGKTTYKREYFVSHADDVIVIKLTADGKEKLNFDVSMDSSGYLSCYSNDDVLYMTGEMGHGQNEEGFRYLTQLKVLLENGTLLADSAEIHVNGATTAYILVSAGTGRQRDGLERMVASLMENTELKKYDELKKAHINTYREKFGRMELNLGQAKDTVSTDERLVRSRTEDEPALAALAFQFGRYLTICDSGENTSLLNISGLRTDSLCNAHPLCQFGDALGGCSGITGMLLQSREGSLEFLPAIPDTWTSGNFKGLCPGDGLSVDAEWENGRLTAACALAGDDRAFKLKIPAYVKTLECNGRQVDISSGFSEVSLKKGEMAVWNIN